MIKISSFTNADPGFVKELWNEKSKSDPSRYYRVDSDILEEQIFGNVLFDRNALLFAFDENHHPLGFIHASFLPNQDWDGPSKNFGVIFPPIVRPMLDNQEEIYRKLILAEEEYLKKNGVTLWFAGGCEKLPPFYIGLYGNGITLGLMEKDQILNDAFQKLGYQRHMRFRSFQLDSNEYIAPITVHSREASQNYVIRINQPPIARNWWEANLYRNFETFEWNVFSRSDSKAPPIAGALVHQIHDLSGSDYCILSDIGVAENCLRSGIGSFLFSTVVHDLIHILRQRIIFHTTIVDKNERLASFLKRHQFTETEAAISYYKIRQ